MFKDRVRENLYAVNPSGVQARIMRVLRRSYQVDSPNSLWHLDGHHKLIRWRIITHGCIDGYSRLITYFQTSSNNRAETVLSAFLKADDEFGLPSRVRTDKGGENVLVVQYILTHPERGLNRRSIITGKAHIIKELSYYGATFSQVALVSSITSTFWKILGC